MSDNQQLTFGDTMFSTMIIIICIAIFFSINDSNTKSVIEEVKTEIIEQIKTTCTQDQAK